jgi:hypothetical protein
MKDGGACAANIGRMMQFQLTEDQYTFRVQSSKTVNPLFKAMLAAEMAEAVPEEYIDVDENGREPATSEDMLAFAAWDDARNTAMARATSLLDTDSEYVSVDGCEGTESGATNSVVNRMDTDWGSSTSNIAEYGTRADTRVPRATNWSSGGAAVVRDLGDIDYAAMDDEAGGEYMPVAGDADNDGRENAGCDSDEYIAFDGDGDGTIGEDADYMPVGGATGSGSDAAAGNGYEYADIGSTLLVSQHEYASPNRKSYDPYTVAGGVDDADEDYLPIDGADSEVYVSEEAGVGVGGPPADDYVDIGNEGQDNFDYLATDGAADSEVSAGNGGAGRAGMGGPPADDYVDIGNEDGAEHAHGEVAVGEPLADDYVDIGNPDLCF